MQFRDLEAQYHSLKKEIDEAMLKVVSDCHFISGKEVSQLEVELAEYVGVKHCITCANGTDALSLAMMAWNIGEGDAVFIPDFTFFSTGEIVSHVKATPIFVDVDPITYNISPESLENEIKEVIAEGKLNPKVIIPVDLFGLPADYLKIKKIADKYHLLILEDGAQGFGGKIGEQRACSFGDISTTSFFPAKPLGCYGDGGAIFTNDDELAKLIRSLCVHGKGSMKYDNVRIGLNSRLDTLQAAILLIKLKAFKEVELDAVNKVAEKYTELLKGVTHLPVVPQGYISSWAQYTIQLSNKEERDGLQAYLKDVGIPSMIYYPKPMHEQVAFSYLNLNIEDYPITSKLCETVLSLPMHPYLKDEDILQVVHAVKEYLNKN